MSEARYHGKAWKSRQTSEGRATSYRHVEPLAVASLVLGALSFLPMFGWPMIPFPIAGALVAWLALRQIEGFPGERTGRGLAIAGLSLSLALGVLGVGFYAFFVVYDVPIGYASVTFTDLQPDREQHEILPRVIASQNVAELPADETQTCLELAGRIYIKGYMYPGRRSVGIQQFVLVPSQWHCKFCQRELNSTEMIKVTMTGDELADYSVHMVGVGGKLKIDPREALRPLGGMPYHIEADVFRK
jgi:hypothetical protein